MSNLKEELKQRLRQVDPEYRYYKTIFNLIGGMVAITDGYKIFDANKAFVDFFIKEQIDIFEPAFNFASLLLEIDKYGYVYEGYLQKPWHTHVLSGDKKQYKVGIKGLEEIYSFSLTLSLLDEGENIFVLTLSDVTDMMSYKGVLEEGIKASLHEKEEAEYILNQYNHAIDVSNLLARCDLEGRIMYVNEALCQTLQYNYEELVGQQVSMLFETESESACEKIGLEKIYQGKLWRGILKNRDKKGNFHYFATTIVPIKNQHDEIVEILSIRHDMTEMVQAKEEAVATLALKTKFFDQVSHELRTPLNAIVNFTDQALESYDEIVNNTQSQELVKKYLQRAYANAQELLELINSLLDLAKIKSGKSSFEMSACNVVALVKEAFDNCASLKQAGVEDYEFISNYDALYISCDAGKLYQIIRNLLSNALKFTQSGYVRVLVYEIDKEYYIDVQDSGIGIASEKIASIFEPFSQAREHGFGTGLGLSIVHEYAEAMGMKIDVTSELNKGSCFSLSLPKQIKNTSTCRDDN